MNNSSEQAELRWVMNGDVQLAVECWGDGPIPLIFSHGWISSRRMWYECLALLNPARYHAMLLDFRGCGESDRPDQGHTLEGYVSDLAAVVDFMRKPALLIGHSMGGRVAQRLAGEKQHELAGLVLVAPGTAQGSEVVPRQRQLAALAFGSRRRITSFQRGAMLAPVSEAAAVHLVEGALYAQRKHWFGWYDEGRVDDFSAVLRNIHLPTIVVLAEKDPLLPLGRGQRDVVEQIVGAERILVPDCGHNIPIEAPSQVVAGITWLAERVFGTGSSVS